jgi:hypothetical protein
LSFRRCHMSTHANEDEHVHPEHIKKPSTTSKTKPRIRPASVTKRYEINRCKKNILKKLISSLYFLKLFPFHFKFLSLLVFPYLFCLLKTQQENVSSLSCPAKVHLPVINTLYDIFSCEVFDLIFPISCFKTY